MAKTGSPPMAENNKEGKELPYRPVIGSLLYLSTYTRLDIKFLVGIPNSQQVCQKSKNCILGGCEACASLFTRSLENRNHDCCRYVLIKDANWQSYKMVSVWR